MEEEMKRFFEGFGYRKKPEQPCKFDHERTIPPHVVACKVCGGRGLTDLDEECPQCKGSGRVIVSHEVKTYITAFVPEK